MNNVKSEHAYKMVHHMLDTVALSAKQIGECSGEYVNVEVQVTYSHKGERMKLGTSIYVPATGGSPVVDRLGS